MFAVFRKLAVIIAVLVIGGLAFAFVYEWNTFQTAQMKLNVGNRLASNDALGRFQSLYSDSNDYFIDYQANDYIAYLDSIQYQAEAFGLNNTNSDLHSVLYFLRSNSGVANGQMKFSPLQFDWTFLDQRGVEVLFDTAARTIVSHNLGKDASMNNANGFEIAEVVGTSVRVTGPILIDLSDSANEIDFSQIFGTAQRAETLNNINNSDTYDQRYNYVIAYDCVFRIHWKFHTRIPYLRGLTFEAPDVVLNRRYIITN